MPDFTYNGPSPGAYPTLRDAYGVLAGTVTPGDVLEFDQAPDGDWVPYEGGGGIESGPDPADAPRPAPAAARMTSSPHASDDEAGTGQEEG